MEQLIVGIVIGAAFSAGIAYVFHLHEKLQHELALSLEHQKASTSELGRAFAVDANLALQERMTAFEQVHKDFLHKPVFAAMTDGQVLSTANALIGMIKANFIEPQKAD